jgi:hypothetical protein
MVAALSLWARVRRMSACSEFVGGRRGGAGERLGPETLTSRKGPQICGISVSRGLAHWERRDD